MLVRRIFFSLIVFDVNYYILLANNFTHEICLVEMDKNIAIAPNKKRKTETEYQYCIICQLPLTNEQLVANPKLESLEIILSLTRERHSYGDTSVADFFHRMKNCTSQIIQNDNGTYHRSCYKDLSNKSKRDRAKDRFEKAVKQRKASLSQSKAGRPVEGKNLFHYFFA